MENGTASTTKGAIAMCELKVQNETSEKTIRDMSEKISDLEKEIHLLRSKTPHSAGENPIGSDIGDTVLDGFINSIF